MGKSHLSEFPVVIVPFHVQSLKKPETVWILRWKLVLILGQNWPFGPKEFSGKFLFRDFCLLNVRYYAAKLEKSLDQILRNGKKEKSLKTHRHIDTYTG